MTLEQLVAERLSVDLSANLELMQKWGITKIEDTTYMRLLALISEEDKTALERALTQEKKVIMVADQENADKQTIERTRVITELDERLGAIDVPERI